MLTCRQAYITCADPLAVTQRSSTSHLANSIIARSQTVFESHYVRSRLEKRGAWNTLTAEWECGAA
jgi:hypothetical protein